MVFPLFSWYFPIWNR